MTRSGIELSRAYHRDVVGPLLERRPGLRYAAARLGSGSDVLGLDDAVSRDHDWGLRLDVLVPGEQVSEVRAYLEESLPETYAGRPTRFVTSWEPTESVQVQVDSVEDFAVSRLGLDPRQGLDAPSWLGLTGQSILEVTAGEVFHDGTGELTAVREALRWYPDDLWRHVLAADWSRLAEELPLAGRAGQRGDDTGSRVVAGRAVRTAMHLGFLLARRWPPYAKWLGTVYGSLDVAGSTAEPLGRAMSAETWRERESGLVEAVDALLARQRSLGLPTPQQATEAFYDRPFRTVRPDVARLLLDDVTDPAVRALPEGVGAVEQWVDSVAVLRPARRRLAAARAVLGA